MEEEKIRVNSIEEEYAYIMETPCEACGGLLETVSQALLSDEVDQINTRCKDCGKEKNFFFDISSFFGKI